MVKIQRSSGNGGSGRAIQAVKGMKEEKIRESNKHFFQEMRVKKWNWNLLSLLLLLLLLE